MIKTAPPPDSFVCEVCQCELASQKHLQTHKLCHFNTSHVCYACDTYFVHSDTLVMHMATMHRDLNPGGQAAIDDGLVCSVCLQVGGTDSFCLADVRNPLNRANLWSVNNYCG